MRNMPRFHVILVFYVSTFLRNIILDRINRTIYLSFGFDPIPRAARLDAENFNLGEECVHIAGGLRYFDRNMLPVNNFPGKY